MQRNAVKCREMQRNQIKVKVILFLGKSAPNLKKIEKWLLADACYVIDQDKH